MPRKPKSASAAPPEPIKLDLPQPKGASPYVDYASDERWPLSKRLRQELVATLAEQATDPEVPHQDRNASAQRLVSMMAQNQRDQEAQADRQKHINRSGGDTAFTTRANIDYREGDEDGDV